MKEGQFEVILSQLSCQIGSEFFVNARADGMGGYRTMQYLGGMRLDGFWAQ
jgi:hypothetical protein